MRRGDILVYIGENEEKYKVGQKVEFLRDLEQLRLPEDEEYYFAIINKSALTKINSSGVQIVKSKDFIDLKTFRRDNGIDNILN